MDTLDSVLMTAAYGWAFVKPVRKLWYNLTITATSVAVALFIGSIEALALVSDKMGLDGGLWDAVAALNDNLANFGFAVVGIFLGGWLVSMALYRLKGYDRLQISSS
jgi:high-affinity nickel-transport protein